MDTTNINRYKMDRQVESFQEAMRRIRNGLDIINKLMIELERDEKSNLMEEIVYRTYEYYCSICNIKFTQLRDTSRDINRCECPKCNAYARRCLSASRHTGNKVKGKCNNQGERE